MVLSKFLLLAAFFSATLGNASGAFGAEQAIKLIFGGDVTLGANYETFAPSPEEDPEWPFRQLKEVFLAADLVMVNCESPITRATHKMPKQFNFKMDPRLTRAFQASNIQIVTLANNHIYDYGAEGLRDTLEYLDRFGIAHVGAGMNLEEARKSVVKNIKGRRVAFLGYGNYSPATRSSPGVAYRYPEYIQEDIRKVKSNGADIVVVNFHWGIERNLSPESSDRALAHLAIDSGADIVIGHHPHVVQPMEMYKGKIIAYSLGNFVFGGNRKGPKESILLQVSIHSDNTLAYSVLPISIDPQSTRYQPYVLKKTPSATETIARK